jgi:anthranilate/para-aminobenzoate synthase component II
MLLMVDNYDSFTYNLVQYFYEMNQEVEVYRNDEITISDIRDKSPDYLVISPGALHTKRSRNIN